MMARKQPFSGGNLHLLAMQIVRGAYADLPTNYSMEIRALVDRLLNNDPDKRPNINQILQIPMIHARIKLFLSSEQFKEEFDHTVLHKQNVFAKTKENFHKNTEKLEKV